MRPIREEGESEVKNYGISFTVGEDARVIIQGSDRAAVKAAWMAARDEIMKRDDCDEVDAVPFDDGIPL